MEDRFEAGRVSSANPARRELRIRPAPACARYFVGRAWVWLVLRDASEMRCKVDTVRRAAGEVIVTLAPGITRDEVARTKGAAVVLAASERRSQTAAYGVHAADLIDMKVYDDAGNYFGTVVDACETNANGVIEIERIDGGKTMLPVIEQVIAGVDLERGALVVRDMTPYKVEDES
jgi:ribosomal 30S subunit maturation factor RimM